MSTTRPQHDVQVSEPYEPKSPELNPREVRRRDVLGGLIHEYYEVAA